jgi:transposase
MGGENLKNLDIQILELIYLKDMRKLFLHERVAWKKDAQFRLKVRYLREKPLVDRVFKKLKDKLIDPKLLPKLKSCDAIKYMLSYEKNLRFYLNHPDAKMDNNPSERALRKIIIERKNWMYIGSKSSGKAMTHDINLIQTCRSFDINPIGYLKFIYRNINDIPE